MIDYNPRPFAAQARALCPETNHDDLWFCTTCLMLEQRLTPITMVPGMAWLLAELAPDDRIFVEGTVMVNHGPQGHGCCLCDRRGHAAELPARPRCRDRCGHGAPCRRRRAGETSFL